MISLKIICIVFVAILGTAEVSRAAATNRYVATNSPASAWPYDSWAKAATNIKHAVDAASSNNAGDMVIISNGVYYLTEQIAVSNVIVTNYSGDRRLVIINGNWPTTTNRCFYLNHSNAVISGLTITNGCATNNLSGSGGGVYVAKGWVHDSLITGCRSFVTTPSKGGGGIYVIGGTVTCSSAIGNMVDDCGIDNTTSSGGGGIYADSGTMVSNCIIGWNFSTNGAFCGGLKMNGSVMVANSQILSNYTTSSGGGVVMNNGNNFLYNSKICGNTVSCENGIGGGILARSGGGGLTGDIIRDCLIIKNLQTVRWSVGGGIYYAYGIPIITSCTIVSNQATSSGGGLCCANASGSKTNVSNCIIRDNIAGDLYDTTAGGLNKTSVMFSCVSDGTGFTIEGVVTNDPLFMSGPEGNYHLQKNSPCVNAGTNQSWMLGALDLDGHSRIDRFSGIVDMGFYEYLFQGTMYSVP